MRCFPNPYIATHIILTIAVSIASCVRPFSKLKLSYLRASMAQGRFCDLGLLSVETGETEKTDFDHSLDQFAFMEARNVQL